MKVKIPAVMLLAFFFTVADTAIGQTKKGEVAFERNDKVLTWRTDNSGEFYLADNLGFKINSELSTSLSITSGKGTKDRWYDTVNNKAELNYRMSDKTDLAFTAQENWNKDTMSRLGTSLLTTDYDGSIIYKPVRNLSLNAGAGHIFDRRFDNKDSGSTVEGGFRYNGEPLEKMSFELNGNGEMSNMRRSKDGYGGLGKISYRHDSMNVSLLLTDNLNRRGYFSDIDRRTIEKRKRQTQNLLFSLSKGDFSNTKKSAAVEFTVNLGKKIITDTANENKKSSKFQNNAKGEEKGIGVNIGKSFGRRITTEWGMDYNKIANGVERLSRRRTQTDIATRGSLFFGFGHADTVEVAGMLKRTRIDTPIGIANDRDELKVEGGVLYTRHFSETFETALDFRVLETHYVNIDVSQSSQNKWMKTYLFSPSLVYSPLKSLRIEHAVNVYANYITYDYDNDHSPRSNISRRVTSESWIDIILSPKTLVQMGMMIEENDYGRLNTQGDKLPAEEGLKRFGDVSVEYLFTDWLTLSPHYIYAIRRDWEVSDIRNRTIRREVDQTYGLKCLLFKKENGSVELSVRRIVRKTKRYPVRIRNYISMKLVYGF